MKKLGNQEFTLVTLKDVVSRGGQDKDFFNALLKAPKTALKNNALKLSDDDMKKLNTLVAKTRKVKAKPVIDLFSYGVQLGLLPDMVRIDKDPPPPTPWNVWPK